MNGSRRYLGDQFVARFDVARHQSAVYRAARGDATERERIQRYPAVEGLESVYRFAVRGARDERASVRRQGDTYERFARKDIYAVGRDLARVRPAESRERIISRRSVRLTVFGGYATRAFCHVRLFEISRSVGARYHARFVEYVYVAAVHRNGYRIGCDVPVIDERRARFRRAVRAHVRPRKESGERREQYGDRRDKRDREYTQFRHKIHIFNYSRKFCRCKQIF